MYFCLPRAGRTFFPDMTVLDLCVVPDSAQGRTVDQFDQFDQLAWRSRATASTQLALKGDGHDG